MRGHRAHLCFLGWRPPGSMNSLCPKSVHHMFDLKSDQTFTERLYRLKPWLTPWRCCNLLTEVLIKRHLIYQQALMLVGMLSLLPSLPPSLLPQIHPSIPSIQPLLHPPLHPIHPSIHPKLAALQAWCCLLCVPGSSVDHSTLKGCWFGLA